MKREYKTDIALMTVTNTEFAAVTHSHDWRAKLRPGDDQIYDVAEFERDGVKHSLVHAKTGDFQRFAAYTSCEFAKLLYEKHLPLDDESMQRAGLIL